MMDRSGADRLSQSLGLGLGRVAVKVSEHNGELVSAQSSDNVGFTGVTNENVRYMEKRRIACRVTIAVVYLLEPVKIEEDQAGLDLVSANHREDPGGLPHEGPAIVDRGQRVVVSRGLRFGQGLLQVRNLTSQRVDLPGQRQLGALNRAGQVGGGNVQKMGRLQNALQIAPRQTHSTRLQEGGIGWVRD